MTLSLLLLAAATSGAGFADLGAVDRQVAAFTGAPLGQPGGALTPVDRRLRLQPCRSGLALSWRTPAQDNVVVQCGDANGWHLFVPVKRIATAAAAAQPDAVSKGDSVSIAVSGDGFTVSQPGEALEAGAVGAWIKVRPASAGASLRDANTMRARVERPGLVVVPVD